MEKNKLLMVSLDAVSTDDLNLLLQGANFSKLVKKGTLVKEVDSIYISNTYPIHTSMITGVLPNKHGIEDNTYLQYGQTDPPWRWQYSLIQRDNIVSQALKYKLKVGSIFWPVMAKAPLKYNLPEILARDHENQTLVVLKNSTKFFALKYYLKYGKTVQGSKQPQLDDFSTKVACAVLKENKVDLLMLHLTDVDSTKHLYGYNSPQASDSVKRMDVRLGQLLEAAGDNYQIMVVSDHAQVDAHNYVDLNEVVPFANVWFHLSEGSAVLLEKEKLDETTFVRLKDWLSSQSFVRRFATADELESSGFNKYSRLVVIPDHDWAFSFKANQHIGNHGYPLDLDNYQPFYFTKGKTIPGDQILTGGSVLDICPLALKLLDLPLFANEGKLRIK